jgi:PQQ-like domain
MNRPAGKALIAIVAVVALAGCWLQPGFGSERSGFNPLESGITPANVALLHVKWTKQLTGAVNAPAVTADGVYATSGGYPDAGTVALLSRADGSTLWTKALFAATSFYDSGPPTLLGGKVYVPTTGISAIAHDSVPVFDAGTGALLTPIAQRAFEVIARGNELVGTQSEGSSSGIAFSSLFVADTVGTGTWSTYLDIESNSTLITPTSAAVGADRFFIGRGGAVQAWPLAQPASCPIVSGITFCDPIWTTTVGASGPSRSHPVLSPDDATVYFAAGTSVAALAATTGAPAWSGALGAAASGPPALGNGYVYVPTGSGELDVFAANGCGHPSCSPLWHANTTSAITQPPAVVSGGVVYTASADGTVRAYPSAGCGHTTCTSLWSAATGSTITGGPVPDLGKVYVGTADGRLIAYSL